MAHYRGSSDKYITDKPLALPDTVASEQAVLEILQDMNVRLAAVLKEIKLKKKAQKAVSPQDTVKLNAIYNELITTKNTIMSYLKNDNKQTKLF